MFDPTCFIVPNQKAGSAFNPPRIEHIADSRSSSQQTYLTNALTIIGSQNEMPFVYDNWGFVDSKKTASSMNETETKILIKEILKTAVEQANTKAAAKGFPVFKETVLKASTDLLALLLKKDISNYHIYPIADGGISIEISKPDTYYNFELYNEDYATFYKEIADGMPEAWELDFVELNNKISEEFSSNG